MDEKSDTYQLRIKDGELVERPSRDSDVDHTIDPAEPGQRTGFSVEVKSGALNVNEQLRKVIETHGRTFDFGSRQHAENYTHELSTTGSSLRIQAAPENEPKSIDGYLLAEHNPSVKEPAEIDEDTWTFDVEANLYGALGEVLLLESPKPHSLVYFVRRDLNVTEEDLEWELNIDVDRGSPVPVDTPSGEARWIPDCVVEVTDGWKDELLERYYCEIKTGSASFERSQREERVLKIRVSIDDLPD